MKRTLSMIAFAALTVGLLGSCSKINERLDNLEKKVDGIENEQIASINTQIASINSSIADLGTIRSDISSLKQSASDHSVDIFNLEEADRALKDRILNLEDYVDAVLPNYAEKEWVEATFSTLEQYEATCDTIAKIDAKLGSTSEKLSKDIKACADSLTKWVNKTFEGYYTAAQMDAKLAQMKADIDSSKASGKISDAKADSIATELTNAKAAVDTAKANIRAEYRAAIDTAIKASEGKLTKELTEAITTVNTAITNLTTRVTNLKNEVDELTGRVDKLEGMIQSVVIVPAYSDGSLEDVEGGILTIECIISPASASKNLKKGDFKVLVSPVKDKQTKAVTLDTAEVSDIKIGENGIVSIFAQAPAKPSTGAYAAALRIVQTGANADYTTEFHTFGYSDKNVKVVDLKEDNKEYKKVYIAPSEASEPKKGGEGKIPAKIDDKLTFEGSRPTVIEVVGIGTVTFDTKATEAIANNAQGADSVYFTVKDVTSDAQKQAREIVYQVTMTKVNEGGEEVFSESNAAGEVTMEIPLGSDVADVTKVTLLNEEGKPIDGGVVYGSVIYDSVNKIVTFKVNHFSRYAVGYVLQKDYKPVTGISLDKSALELEKGTSKKLIATIKPDNASNKNVIWSSSDTSKVKVDTAGKVTAVALGTATVTATSMNNRSLTATCEVTVVELKSYVEIAAKYNGSTTTTLRWYRQSLAITDSGKKAWKGGSGSAVKIPGTDENVVVGDYFPWGTFAGFYGSGAGSDKGLLPYDSFTNKGCGDGSDGFTFKTGKKFDDANAPYYSGSAYTKYNATDGKTTLDASDDVASIILGGTWRMPTQAELQAMKEATYWAWDATDKGYYVYDPNPATDAGKVNNGTGTYDKADALLFFPATGYGGDTSMSNAGTFGYYRSSTLKSGDTENAYRLYFYDGGVNPNVYTNRYCGFSVRPVQDPTAKYEAVTKVSLELSEANFEEGDTLRMSATVSPAGATQNGVYWTSSDTTKVTVDATGTVIAKAVGTATIKVTTVDGGKTATCTVTVKGTKSMAKILKTNSGIPESQNLTPPANAWVNSTDTLCKAFVGIDAKGDTLFVILKEGSGLDPLGMCMDDDFEKIDDNTYKRVEESVGTFTIKMTGGRFTSYEFTAVSGSADEVLNGTYAAPKPVEPEYVEIGGLKWATKNLGAEKVTDYGDYFAWGETAPYYEGTGGRPATPTWKSGKTSGYKWDSYCGQSSFVEWSTPPYDATTKILKPDFDAAAQILGDGWRMPTSADLQALNDACGGTDLPKAGGSTSTTEKGVYWCTNYDGVAGLLFCDGTNKLFFPAAGRGNGTGLDYAGSGGSYWLSSLNTDYTTNAYYFDFNEFYKESNYLPSIARYCGFSVRPVKAAAAGVSGNGTEQYNNNSNPDWFSK